LLETETELIRKLRQGDPLAFHRLVDAYANRLYGLAYSLLGNAEDAEDVVQETLGGAFRSIGSFQQRASLWTWLAKILVRQVARVHRSRGSPMRMMPTGTGAADDSRVDVTEARTELPAAVQVDARVDVATALASLSEEHRQVIVLRELQHLSYGEISDMLAIPLGTVESRLFRARAELRLKLRDWR
jgi:RNA polymerase sigma-70 factor, ECF subfamily